MQTVLEQIVKFCEYNSKTKDDTKAIVTMSFYQSLTQSQKDQLISFAKMISVIKNK